MSSETKQKLSESLKKTWTSERRIRNAEIARETHTGRKRTIETRKKLSEAKLGDKNPNYKSPMTPEFRRFHSDRLKKLHSEGKICTWKDFAGEKHWNWQGGITEASLQARNSEEYRNWRTAVFERDAYTCIFCGQIGGILNADHIKPFSLYPESRYDVDNGRTMCKKCHEVIGWNYPRHLKYKKALVEMEVF